MDDPNVRSTRRVLVVDDNVDAAELLALMLRRAGFEASAAFDAESALDLADRFSFEVAVLDLELPEMDGCELGTQLRAIPQCARCRLVALSGHGQGHDRERTQQAGFEAHLVKPVAFDALLEVLGATPP